jgi:hypothetical protein
MVWKAFARLKRGKKKVDMGGGQMSQNTPPLGKA